jgi:hypothetical protein
MGIYVLGPIGGIQSTRWQALEQGAQYCTDRGVKLAWQFTNEPGGPPRFRLIMPGARIGYRRVYTGHDPAPGIRALLPSDGEFVLNSRGEITPLIRHTSLRGAIAYSFANGADWFNRFWNAEYSQIQGVDYFSFANEWFLNGQSKERVSGFAQFYVELMKACLPFCECTVGDFSVGTPGLPSIPQEANDIEWLAPMFETAERLGMPADFHTYDLPDPAGGIMPREYTWLRWQPYVERWPNLLIWAGEAGPEGSRLFRPETQGRMMNYADVMWPLRNLIAGCEWCICDPVVQQNPEGNWSGDDWTPILPWFFPWTVERSAQR